MNKERITAVLEAILAEVKSSSCGTTVTAANGNRTVATTSYVSGTSKAQDVVDCLRRFIRKTEDGQTMTTKERNISRRAIKALKASGVRILNTNGNDVLTQNGAR